MKWHQVAERWPAFVQAAGQRWPRADRAMLLALDGDRERLEAYIALTHDLTPAEVREDVDTWLTHGLAAATAMEESSPSPNDT